VRKTFQLVMVCDCAENFGKRGKFFMRYLFVGLMVLAMDFPGVALADPASHSYKWVKDEKISSANVLTSGQSSRIVPVASAQALELVRQVMGGDLHLSLANYSAAYHRQVAETTPETLVPKQIAKKEVPSLASEDYKFMLEAQLKADGNQTRITLLANPIYRVDTAKAPKAVHSLVEIRNDSTREVNLGPIFVMPPTSQPEDFDMQTLPDAAERAAQLVRACMYYLDERPADKP
jgi:hypothetical protein